MKYDGYRCRSRSPAERLDLHPQWPRLDRQFPKSQAAQSLTDGAALLDGDRPHRQGNTSFSALQEAIGEGGTGLTLFLFDALEIDGKDLTALGTVERKARLATLVGPGRSPLILYADHIIGQGEKLFEAMCAAGQEGTIAKRADAPYRGGRSRSWLKIKCTNRQEFVIIGWTLSERKGRGFRSLLLAVSDKGKLRYAGKVGTGFRFRSCTTSGEVAATGAQDPAGR